MNLRRRRLVTVAAGLAATALILAGCASAASGNGGGGGGGDSVSVPADASKEEWQAAFADIEPVNIVYQAAVSSSGSSAPRFQRWADKMEEYSDGKVTVEIVWSYGIAGITESDEALRDGRIDAHNFSTFSSPSEFPINGQLVLDSTVLRDSSLLEGSLTMFGATNQTAWEVSDVAGELSDNGLTPIIPVAGSALSGLVCSDPVTSLADLKGKMIRTGPLVHVGQVEALGATSVNLPFTELYEALQRGIIDCAIYGVGGLAEGGILEVAPYVITPVGTSFATSTASETAGVNWDSWPLVVKQLHFDLINEMTVDGIGESLGMMDEISAEVTANGGEFLEFDEEANDALREHNDEVLKSLAKTDLLDGDEFTTVVQDQFSEWKQLVQDAGYSSATLVEYDDQLSGNDIDLTAYKELYRERILEPNRPK
ncbi:hypothetical protein [Microbacterium sp.]|uniref:hypothetical protein n=1 Tax=Microbacterium sp. TaxID=51671 RepID=UPI002736C34A|nr:hypothetical protein [Microbacterium sp.]MDP3950436.1 hypothetical protein [Microbacterium sp.]